MISLEALFDDGQSDPEVLTSADRRAAGAVSEDIRFFTFVRKYLGLVATITFVPILSSAFEILPGPALDEKLKFNLSALTSFICLIAFASTFLLLRPLAKLVTSKRTLVAIIPFAMSFVLAFVGIVLCAEYLEIRSAERIDHWREIMLFLSIYPVFVLSLGIVLVTAFTLNVDFSIQNLVYTQIPNDAEKIYSALMYYVTYHEHAMRFEALQNLGGRFLSQAEKQLKYLSAGQVEVDRDAATWVEGLLCEAFRKRFDAVSDRDIDFWLNEANDNITSEYVKIQLKAITDYKTIFTRVFIIDDKELFYHPQAKSSEKPLNKTSRISEVLIKHQQVGIGWALALYDELDPIILKHQKDAPIDFALHDEIQAVSHFREYRIDENSRLYRVIFRIPENEEIINRQIDQYLKILKCCWMADENFCKHVLEYFQNLSSAIKLSGNDQILESIKQRTSGLLHKFSLTNDPEFQMREDQIFPIELKPTDDREKIEEGLRKLQRLRRLSKEWFHH